MRKGIRDIFIFVSSIAMLFSLSGCAPSRETKFNTELETALKSSYGEVSNFEYMGADVVKSSFNFDVMFNGIARLNDGSKGFASVKYEVSSSEFDDVEKFSEKDKIYDVFDKIVKEYNIKEFTFAKMDSLKNFNNIILGNTPSPIDKYSIKRGMVYNVGEVELDDQTRSASFDVKIIHNLYKSNTELSPGIGFSFTSLRWGYGYALSLDYATGTFIIQDKYTVNFSEEEYALIQQNPALLYQVVQDKIENRDEENISAERVNVVDVSYDKADRLKGFYVDAQEEMLDEQN